MNPQRSDELHQCGPTVPACIYEIMLFFCICLALNTVLADLCKPHLQYTAYAVIRIACMQYFFYNCTNLFWPIHLIVMNDLLKALRELSTHFLLKLQIAGTDNDCQQNDCIVVQLLDSYYNHIFTIPNCCCGQLCFLTSNELHQSSVELFLVCTRV